MALAPPRRYFIGYSQPGDTDTYFAKMQTGAEEGIFLYRNRLTTEEHSRAPLFHFFLIAEKLARELHLDFVSMYHLARVIFSFALLFYLYHESRRPFFPHIFFSRRRNIWQRENPGH